MSVAAAMKPVDLVRAYYENVWAENRVELIPQFCADGVLRHDLKGTVRLNHEQQRERILAHPGLQHRIVQMHGDDQFATMFFEVRRPDGELVMAGIEVLRIENGKIVENWTGIRPGLSWDV